MLAAPCELPASDASAPHHPANFSVPLGYQQFDADPRRPFPYDAAPRVEETGLPPRSQ
jgi:hypothetical protein